MLGNIFGDVKHLAVYRHVQRRCTVAVRCELHVCNSNTRVNAAPALQVRSLGRERSGSRPKSVYSGTGELGRLAIDKKRCSASSNLPVRL